MKKISSIIGLIVLSLFISNCNKESSTQENENVVTQIVVSLSDADYDQIGIKHNQELENAFKAIKSEKSKRALSTEDLFNIISETTFSLIENDTSVPNSLDLNETKYQINGYKKIFMDYTKSYKKGDPELYLKLTEGSDTLLTTTQKNISNKIFSVLLDKTLNISDMQAKFDSIENVIKLTCTEIDKPSLLSSLSIARHSSSYWNDNYSKWNEALGGPDNKSVADPLTWRFVALVDIGMALVDAVLVSPVVLFPFIGWAAYVTHITIVTGISSGMAVIALIVINNLLE